MCLRPLSVPLLLLPILLSAQPLTERYKDMGDLFIIPSTHAMFPHPARDAGHVYGGRSYPADLHYRDSSVAIFVPKGFRSGDATDLVVYFHGWRNSIDSAFGTFRLAEQFAGSGVNAVFVFPEGPKNAPDSFGGKLEEADGFKLLVGDVLNALTERHIVRTRSVGSIVLAGHSGAGRVMSFILLRGGLTDRISEVILFDGLYEKTEKFTHWLDHSTGRFVNIYTADGGTKQESENLMDDLSAWGISFRKVQEPGLTGEDLRSNRILFIESDLTHDDVIGKRDQFRELLRASGLRMN
jgi:hypothetical protein